MQKTGRFYLTNTSVSATIGCNYFLFFKYAIILEVQMGKNFIKFRRRVRAEAIASSLLIGVATGSIAYASVAITVKLLGKVMNPFYYWIFGGAALLVSLILYFVFTPSDKRLAKRLDAVYSLDEKVSTMVEFSDSDDEFAVIQREDAEEKLGSQPMRALKSTKLIAGVLAFVIAAGSLVGSFLIPVKANSEAPIGEFDKQWILTALNELITIVEGAYIDDTLKESSLTELKSLRSFVEGSQLLSEMKGEAIKTVIAISDDLRIANSAEAISEKLVSSQDENIKKLGSEMADLSGSGTKKALEKIGETISNSNPNDGVFIAEELDVYLQASGVRSDDTVYMLLKTLVATIKADPSVAKSECESAAKVLSASIILQNVNKSTINVVINKLCNLFGITEKDITAVNPDVDIDINGSGGSDNTPGDSDADEPDNNIIGSGGLGTGEVIYGSNDMIFDPHTNTYRPYGEILNEYFAKVNEYITDGKTSSEISDALEKYFSILYGGTGKG